MTLKFSLLIAGIVAIATVARAESSPQEEPPASPLYVLGTTWSRPMIQVLKSEETPNRRYQKWRETYLVTLAVTNFGEDARVFYSQPLHVETYEVQLQARSHQANFERKWQQLKTELTGVRSATPQLQFWDSSRWTSRGTLDYPRSAFTARRPTYYYVLIAQIYEMEAVKDKDNTIFKASVIKDTAGAFSSSLCAGQTFDRQTGEIFDDKGQLVHDALKSYREGSGEYAYSRAWKN